MSVPYIPDDAFAHLGQRIDALLAVIKRGASPGEVQESTSNFYRALGLDGEYDARALYASALVMGHLRRIDPDKIPPEEVSVAVLGMVLLGLLLAEGTGWEAPIR